MPAYLVPFVPAIVAVLLAAAAYIRAEAAHRMLNDHVSFKHDVTVSTVRQLPPHADGARE